MNLKQLSTVKVRTIALLIISMGIAHSSYAAELVSLGSVSFSNPIASVNADRIGETIDGDFGGEGSSNHWQWDTNKDSEQNIWWDLSTTAPNLRPDQSVTSYKYEIMIRYGWSKWSSLTNFSLDATYGTGSDHFRVTNFEELTSSGGDSGVNLVANSNGEITATEGYGMNHLFIFNTDQEVSRLRLNMPARGALTNVRIAEISGTAHAVAVPEPSTYALMLGVVAFLFIAYKKRIQTHT